MIDESGQEECVAQRVIECAIELQDNPESGFQELGLSLDIIQSLLANGRSFAYNQHWLTAADRAFAPGTVKLGRSEDRLVIFADLHGTQINTKSFPFNFPAFQENDVFEIFLHGIGSTVYYEFHITPSNSVMQLRFPLERPEDDPFEPYRVSECLLNSRTRIGAKGWQVAVILPLPPLSNSLLFPENWALSFGRYDYPEGNSKPVISSTSPHTIRQFHRRMEWPLIDLKDLPHLHF